MLTRRLFEENVKTQRFEAKVLSCTEEKGKCRIELDATAFFPEGGGQPGDQGELFPGLNENGEPVRVLDTREKAGYFVLNPNRHILNTLPDSFDNIFANVNDATHQIPNSINNGIDDLRK